MIHVGKKSGRCPGLKVIREKMYRVKSTKRLGDLFHEKDKSKFTIIERTTKANATLAEILAILADVP